MANYWIKLYHEVLDDPKMGRLPDRTWRRCIELFLLAGTTGETGELPSIEDICWKLRIDETTLLEDLAILEKAGIIQVNDNNPVVTHFTERQDADTNAERVKHHREQKRTSNPIVTNEKRMCNVSLQNIVQELELNKDINFVSAEAQENSPPDSTKNKDPGDNGLSKLEKDRIRGEVQQYFLKITGLPRPLGETKAENGKLYWVPIREICGLVEWDVGRAENLVEAAVKRLRKDDMTISSPKSILKTVLSIYADGNGNHGRNILEGMNYMGGGQDG